jgi:membrane dipeptidase
MASFGEITHQNSVVIDALNVSNWDSPAVFESLNNGGITGINATIAVWEGFAETMDNIAQWMVRFRDYSGLITQATSASDILQAKEDGKTGVVFGWQNTSPIGSDLKRLELFHALGVRIVQVTYNERNLVGNGCYERDDNGLSNFGLDVVKDLNRLGILIDLSHVGDRTTLETADRSQQPVACTHANARSMFDHPRNKTDEALKLVTERGGVIGANAYPPFLANGFQSAVSDYVDVIDDLVERVGIDHVGIGTDYCQDQPVSFFDWIFSQQGTKLPERSLGYPDPFHHPLGMETPDGFASIASDLSNRGYAEPDIKKVIGGNWMRLFREVWGE